MAKNNRLHPHECSSAKKDSPPTARRTSMNSILANKGFLLLSRFSQANIFVRSFAISGNFYSESWNEVYKVLDGRPELGWRSFPV